MKKKLFLSILFISLIIIDLQIGKTDLSFLDILKILSGKEQDQTKVIIFYNFRLIRVLSAIAVGSSLAISGLLLQTLFSNPLASPYVLGISSGSTFGIALYVLILSVSGFEITNQYGLSFFGILGSISVLILILWFYKRTQNPVTVLIIGVLTAGILTSAVNLFMYFSIAQQLKKYVVWTMGSLEYFDYQKITIISVLLFISLIIIYGFSRSFDLLYIKEDAIILGLNKNLIVAIIIIISGLLTGVSVSFAGPVAFIGIISPHLARIVSKSVLHKYLIINSLIIGSSFLLIADIISHLPVWTGILPINTITSVLGIPVIFFIILGKKSFFV